MNRARLRPGLELKRIQENFLGCDVIPMLELKEKLLGDFDAEKIQLDLSREPSDCNWHEKQTRTLHRNGKIEPAMLKQCSRDFLEFLKGAIELAFRNR